MKVQLSYLILFSLILFSYSLKHQQTGDSANDIQPIDNNNTAVPEQKNNQTNDNSQTATNNNSTKTTTNTTQSKPSTQKSPSQSTPNDDTAKKTTEQKPAEQKPAEQKPAEQKPAEQKPAEQKPAEQKPAEQKPAEQKPAEQKPAENNKSEEVKETQKIAAQQKEQADRLIKQAQAESKQKLDVSKQLQELKEQGVKKMKQLYDELAKSYEPKPEDKSQLSKTLTSLSSSTDELIKNLKSRLLKVTGQLSHHLSHNNQQHNFQISAINLQQSQHLLSVSSTQCYNLTDEDQKLLNDSIAQLQANLTKSKIFLDKAKLNSSLATQQQVQDLQTQYNNNQAKLNQLRAIKRCTNEQLSNNKPSATPVTLPTGLGVSQPQSYFKHITNLNAPNWILGDQTIDQYTDKLFNFLTHNNVTKCPLQTPYARKSDNQCINCTDPKPVFDLLVGDCVACPEGTKLDPQTHKCVPSEQKPPVESKCKANYVWNQEQKKCLCPQSFPIDLGCQCVTCLEPFAWNVNQKACKLRCEESHVWNKQKQACECPTTSPYEVNGQCIACSLPFQWQATLNTCTLKVDNCAAQTQPVTPITPVTPVTPIQPQPKTIQCGSNYVYDNNVQNCICPTSLPFNDGKKCVSCDLPQYWDHDLKSCLYCPDFKYFSALTRNCEPCPADKPLFRNHICQSCAVGTTYDRNSNTCLSNEAEFIEPAVTNKIPAYSTGPSY